MKSYQQYCSVARALDVVGDRWVLLIVRELLSFGPSRYSDLRRGLPGIASNLLADRLKSMATDGLIEHHQAPPPVGSRVYQLTDRGRELDEVMRALSRWGVHQMLEGPSEGDAVQPQWGALLAGLDLAPRLAPGTELVIGIDTGSEPVRALLRNEGFQIDRAMGEGTDVMLRGDAQLIGGVLTGLLTVTEATDLGLSVTDPVDRLTGLVEPLAGRTHV